MSNFLAAEIVARFRLKPDGPNRWRGNCPVREHRPDALVVSQNPDGTAMIHCFANCSFESILPHLKDIPRGALNGAPALPAPDPSAGERKERARKIWDRTLPLDSNDAAPARLWLEALGLRDLDRVAPARFSKGFAAKDGTVFPHAIVVPMAPLGLWGKDNPLESLTAIQFLFLTDAGRPAKDRKGLTKRSVGVAGSAVTVLGPSIRIATGVAVVEGFKDAATLATTGLVGPPRLPKERIVVTHGGGTMRKISFPPVFSIRIFPDADPAGWLAAADLEARHASIGGKTHIFWPKTLGKDPADVILRKKT